MCPPPIVGGLIHPTYPFFCAEVCLEAQKGMYAPAPFFHSHMHQLRVCIVYAFPPPFFVNSPYDLHTRKQHVFSAVVLVSFLSLKSILSAPPHIRHHQLIYISTTSEFYFTKLFFTPHPPDAHRTHALPACAVRRRCRRRRPFSPAVWIE